MRSFGNFWEYYANNNEKFWEALLRKFGEKGWKK
jgi:hypothetical protein